MYAIRSYYGSIGNTASVSSDSTDDNPGNNDSTVLTALDQSADISVAMNCPSDVVAGSQVQYTITVTNNETLRNNFV